MTALLSLASGAAPSLTGERSMVLDILVVLAAAALATLGLRRLRLMTTSTMMMMLFVIQWL